MIDTARILRDGAVLSAIASAGLPLLGWLNPRFYLHHLPAEIQAAVPPRSEREQRTSILLGLLIGTPLIAALFWRTSTLQSHAFVDRFAYAFGVPFIFNLVDLIILDWLVVCRFKPRWSILAGTEHIVFAHPYLHHFREFLMGTAGLIGVALAITFLLNTWS